MISQYLRARHHRRISSTTTAQSTSSSSGRTTRPLMASVPPPRVPSPQLRPPLMITLGYQRFEMSLTKTFSINGSNTIMSNRKIFWCQKPGILKIPRLDYTASKMKSRCAHAVLDPLPSHNLTPMKTLTREPK